MSKAMVNQIPTPVNPPKTMVKSRKNLLCFLVYSRMAEEDSRYALISLSTRNRPPPTAKWET